MLGAVSALWKSLIAANVSALASLAALPTFRVAPAGGPGSLTCHGCVWLAVHTREDGRVAAYVGAWQHWTAVRRASGGRGW